VDGFEKGNRLTKLWLLRVVLQQVQYTKGFEITGFAMGIS
jgi:hypothetical protein